ncbi:hypothetical protein PR202_gb04814 [Eleusine coracana subsp. coracana]|uniref:Tr-type G domain-containing protein n=1 Tax=Eleusine coracana subsp. coracana TaxID=191504 RepID=A0AAV5E5B6_ELECO|nr:hypothetical protein PR202_gb04814 [Eleusine coracana subsp. coracana]
MVKFTVEEMRRIMDKKNNIGNMSVAAHVDHGKSTLTDSLVAAAGIIAQDVAGDVRMTDTRADEAERGITIKSTDALLGDVQVYPEKGTVAFSTGLHGWAFTLSNFAKMYASKFGVDESKMMERLWGENYFDPSTKKWTSKHTGSATRKRGFVQFCYEPIKQIINTCMNDQKDKLLPMLQKLGISMKSDEKDLTGKALMKRVMQNWLPASNALLEMMIYHLPSPAKAQKYRVENLYEGPLDDIYASSIRKCDPEGPLMLYVSKMIPASDKGRFYAFGRVFSGKVSTGVKRTVIWMGKKQESVEDVPCGNTIAMVGLDQFITKNAILTNEKEVDAYPIKAMKFSVSPVVRVAVQCKVASDLPKLVEGLKRLAKSDPMVLCDGISLVLFGLGLCLTAGPVQDSILVLV